MLIWLAFPGRADAVSQSKRDSRELLSAVAQAIEDELYDLRREREYFEVDENAGGDVSPAEISMYVSKELSPTGSGVVIYKDMPIGEVYRYFRVGKDNLVVLGGDPYSNFPPHGGSVLTIYMSNEKVCDFIQSKAYKWKFAIDPKAPAKRIRDAMDRQVRRIGYSLSRKRGRAAGLPPR